MSRQLLPNRRQGIGRSLDWRGQRIDVTIGFDHEGEAREVFINNAGKIGAELRMILDDAAVLISLCLQHGIDALALYRSLGRVSHTVTGEPSDDPSSVLGEIVATIINTEHHHGRQMRESYAEISARWPAPTLSSDCGLYRGLVPPTPEET